MFSRRTNWTLSPNRLTQAIDAARAADNPFLDLTVSNPTECGLVYDSASILEAFQEPRGLSYDPQPKGLGVARAEVTNYYAEAYGVAVDPEAVFLTTSTSEAYTYLFRLLCDPGDEILVPKPSYPLFEFLGGLQDVALVPYGLEYAQGWLIDFHTLRSRITPRTRAILLVHPNNPTGSYVLPEERDRLNQICREHELALVVDEVFLDYAWDQSRRASFAGNEDALTFTLSGLSKIAGLPQMKIAWLVASGPGPVVASAIERLEIIADTYLSLNAPTQWALPALLRQRVSIQKQLLVRIEENRSLLMSLLLPSKTAELLDAAGGWYAVLRVSAEMTDEERCVRLLREKHVLVHPGHFYDFSGEGNLVLSLITPTDVFAEGTKRLIESL